MRRQRKPGQASRLPRALPALVVAVAGFAVAVASGIAFARSFTLKVGKNVKVTNFVTRASTRESILVNPHGVSLYWLGGETTHHLLCSSSVCLKFWPPDKVSSAHAKLAKGPGVKGKLGVLHRHGFLQLTWNGHPLYMFMLDGGKSGIATGEGVMSFGGTWHVIKAGSGKRAPRTTTTTTTTSSSTAYPYP
jgi:predicted lipoprotein with Yx(FWY)xxD motif